MMVFAKSSGVNCAMVRHETNERTQMSGKRMFFVIFFIKSGQFHRNSCDFQFVALMDDITKLRKKYENFFNPQ